MRTKAGTVPARQRVRVAAKVAFVMAGAALGLAAWGTVSGSGPDLLTAAKLLVEQNYADQQSAAPADSDKKDPDAARPTDPVGEAWPSGIFEDPEAPFPAAQYSGVNRWQTDTAGTHVVVYAGALGGEPSQGVLILQIYSWDLSQVSTREFRVPVGLGALRIVGVSGHQLTVESTSGVDMVFDADRAVLVP